MSQNEKYLIFAHYHTNGLIREDITNFLYESKKHFKKIILVSKETGLPKETTRKVFGLFRR